MLYFYSISVSIIHCGAMRLHTLVCIRKYWYQVISVFSLCAPHWYIRKPKYTETISILIPVQPAPVLPSPLKPDGHIQVKLPTVFTQVAPVTQSADPMVHSLMSGTEDNNCQAITTT